MTNIQAADVFGGNIGQGSAHISDPARAERIRQNMERTAWKSSGNPTADTIELLNELRALRHGQNSDEIIAGKYEPEILTPEEKEERIYAMAAAGVIKRASADHLVAHMAKASAKAAQSGMTSYELATEHTAQQMEMIYERAKLQAVSVALSDARIPPHLQRASLTADEFGEPLVITEGNERAIKLCQRLVDEWTPYHRGLTLYGPSGRGKTYLAMAVLVGLIQKHGAGINGRYITERDLLNYFRDSYKKRADDPYTPSTTSVREWFAVRPQFLVLDDFGSEAPSSGEKGDWARGQMMDFIEYRSRNKLTTFVTTNLADSDIVRMYDDRIASRIYGHSPMITITGADWRQKVRPDDEDPFFDFRIDPSTGRPWMRG